MGRKKKERGDHGVSEVTPETDGEDARRGWNVFGKAVMRRDPCGNDEENQHTSHTSKQYTEIPIL